MSGADLTAVSMDGMIERVVAELTTNQVVGHPHRVRVLFNNAPQAEEVSDLIYQIVIERPLTDHPPITVATMTISLYDLAAEMILRYSNGILIAHAVCAYECADDLLGWILGVFPSAGIVSLAIEQTNQSIVMSELIARAVGYIE
ncbi:hypothetical protein HGA91_05575 [candidate division WWE3 bacterium]|nr:hypothetical protein [candidate division WWE3 bacterium]